MRWGMVVDLHACIGCNACVISCKTRRATPPGLYFNRVLEQEVGRFPAARRTFWPTRCNHCESPSCLEVCPTGATTKRDDGIVKIDPNKCMGCRACILACPYDARTLLEGVKSYYGENQTPYEESTYAHYQEGTVYKCDFCSGRIDQDLKPICVESCPTQALIFGDWDDADSDVNKAVEQSAREDQRSFKLKEEIGNKPAIVYLEQKFIQ